MAAGFRVVNYSNLPSIINQHEVSEVWRSGKTWDMFRLCTRCYACLMLQFFFPPYKALRPCPNDEEECEERLWKSNISMNNNSNNDNNSRKFWYNNTSCCLGFHEESWATSFHSDRFIYFICSKARLLVDHVRNHQKAIDPSLAGIHRMNQTSSVLHAS